MSVEAALDVEAPYSSTRTKTFVAPNLEKPDMIFYLTCYIAMFTTSRARTPEQKRRILASLSPRKGLVTREMDGNGAYLPETAYRIAGSHSYTNAGAMEFTTTDGCQGRWVACGNRRERDQRKASEQSRSPGLPTTEGLSADDTGSASSREHALEHTYRNSSGWDEVE